MCYDFSECFSYLTLCRVASRCCKQTHTMLGSSESSVRGVIPRALEQVAERMRAAQSQLHSRHYEAKVACVEVYNETIRDLLRPDTAVADIITGVTMHPLDPHCAGEIERIMEQITRNQARAQDDGGLGSSRSHVDFSLHLANWFPHQPDVIMWSTLSLVDLAGSKRVDYSRLTPEQAELAAAVNKSLYALTDVFMAIHDFFLQHHL